jgi:hypothetical protein
MQVEELVVEDTGGSQKVVVCLHGECAATDARIKGFGKRRDLVAHVHTAHDSDFKACCMVEPAHRNAAAGSAAALKKVAIPASLPKDQCAQLTVQTR